jgi:hypothetical protein
VMSPAKRPCRREKMWIYTDSQTVLRGRAVVETRFGLFSPIEGSIRALLVSTWLPCDSDLAEVALVGWRSAGTYADGHP